MLYCYGFSIEAIWEDISVDLFDFIIVLGEYGLK